MDTLETTSRSVQSVSQIHFNCEARGAAVVISGAHQTTSRPSDRPTRRTNNGTIVWDINRTQESSRGGEETIIRNYAEWKRRRKDNEGQVGEKTTLPLDRSLGGSSV